jgi:hypothetical protein
LVEHLALLFKTRIGSSLIDLIGMHQRIRKRYLLLLLISLASVASGQDKPIRIGKIELFGYSKVDPDKVRAALPFREGDPVSQETSAQEFERAQKSVERVTGNAPTEIAPICCDGQGNLIIYIGLSGNPMRHLPRPKANSRLPANAIHLNEQLSQALQEGAKIGAVAEDSSKGYSLSTRYAPLRTIQLRMRNYALHHDRRLREVLASSLDARQRTVAAELLGYARQSRSQLSALTHASRDSNSDVRNAATRALVVLVMSNPALAKLIPPESFIEMLLSGTWTDVNKGSFLLSHLTLGRDPTLLAQLRRPKVLERLIEIAHWPAIHATPAAMILGRIAGINERRLLQLVATGQVNVIMAALQAGR